MTHNRHTIAAASVTLAECERGIALVDTVLSLAGCAVSIVGGMYGLFCLFN